MMEITRLKNESYKNEDPNGIETIKLGVDSEQNQNEKDSFKKTKTNNFFSFDETAEQIEHLSESNLEKESEK